MSKAIRKKTEGCLVRSSAAQYLTFIAASGQGVEVICADENTWLTADAEDDGVTL